MQLVKYDILWKMNLTEMSEFKLRETCYKTVLKFVSQFLYFMEHTVHKFWLY